ncbi:cytochrome P450 [Amycolatopsis keratiniphila]|uniref:Epothilone b hydroxylase n=2 Tax=Amycolatopsis TaxID=1813 RepID=Q156A0_AMYOR|nr:cytochrome P450 [Amycolatopsis keratiniphila]ABG22116.1 epothilone b hydroxylase [Amycolatopsis orientalis]OLZ55831.1 cytochrome [Amycolatopsis keratiniphila subsp. nogabecina]ONF65539.1 cytochrome [Amycolatopsis keratiniphila subsp. keratiniphila]SDU49702.1 Cytochrome P450 [Amycolatopsis keratiniphila]
MTDVEETTATLPLARKCPFSPPPEYERLRRESPVSRVGLPSGQTAWALTRLEDIREMLSSPHFSSDRQSPSFPLMVARQIRREDKPFRPSLIAMDPPEHGKARRDVVGEFTVKRMKALQPRIQQIVDEHIDALLAGPKPADLVQALSLPVPSLVICELLGVPYSDHEFFQSCSSRMLSREVTAEERMTAFESLENYLDELVTKKEANATEDDLLGRQILKQRESGEADHGELVGLAFLLLIAGHETTANMISLGTVTLLENPDQLAKIKADPGKTLAAIEELLRIFTIAETATSRFATADVEIGGTLIRAGEGVVGLSNAGNHDPDGFENPDTFDIERGARHHVAFGFGVHQCLGQNLARLELQIVFDTLFRRVPGIRIAVPVDELPFKHDSTIYGLHALPVTW